MTKEKLYLNRRQKGDTGQYKEYDRVYHKAARAAKMAYYAKQFEANASNLGKIWGLVRECQGKSQARDAIPHTFLSGSNTKHFMLPAPLPPLSLICSAFQNSPIETNFLSYLSMTHSMVRTTNQLGLQNFGVCKIWIFRM